MSSWGSIPKANIRPVIKDGIRRINGRQVGLLQEMGKVAGFQSEQALLSFIRPLVNIKLTSLADVPDGPQMQLVVAKLKGEKQDGKAHAQDGIQAR